MVDFEDSSTVALNSLLVGLKAVSKANARDLEYVSPKSGIILLLKINQHYYYYYQCHTDDELCLVIWVVRQALCSEPR